MSKGHRAPASGRASYTLGCVAAVLIMVASGFAYFVKSQVGDIGGSNVLSGGPQTGAMNILLMGLESRTDYSGRILSSQLLTAMHAGSVQGVENGVGGQDTNTLILIHIFAGGKKAVGYSIPRDDWVTYPKPYDGQGQGKIDEAYGLAYNQSLSQTVNSAASSGQRYLEANEAGQAAEIATVGSLTGVRIDHFAEVNLAGFFYLAQSFGGVEVCLKSFDGGHNLHDFNSGFRQKRAGYHLLSAPQALAFVRERDNLPNGDLDRTHRQQAVLDYVIWKLEHQGVFNSLSQLTSLLDTAKKYIITDQGWNLLDFASQMRALSGKNLTFMTAPVITTDGHVGGQDVNFINASAVRKAVQNAFYPPKNGSGSGGTGAAGPGMGGGSAPAAPSLQAAATTVDVYNAGAPVGLAGEMSRSLATAGFKAGTVADTSPRPQTLVTYGTGAAQSASTVAGFFTGITAAPSSSVPAGHVEVVLGPDATSVPQALTAAAAGQTGVAAAPSLAGGASAGLPGTATSAPAPRSGDDGQAGKAVTVRSNAKFGIPCVYLFPGVFRASCKGFVYPGRFCADARYRPVVWASR
ncbi:MAG: LCP family protein [Streptosporangiales bacterium]|nr:LCP family protein [Streptosporangiales bacterium]